MTTAAQSSGLPVRMLQMNSLMNGGGTDDCAVRLAVGLHARGHQIAIAGMPERKFAALAREGGVEIITAGPGKTQLILGTARALRRRRFQILQTHHGRDYWPAVIAALLSGVRPALVIVRHMAKSPSSIVSRRLLLNRCDAMVAVSEFVADVLKKGAYEPDSPEPERRSRPPLHGDHSRISVIRGSFDLDRFQPVDTPPLRASWGLKPEHFAFGVVGSYDLPRGKGQREFLAAAARLKDALPHARFVIVGTGSMRSLLEADIARLGLADVAIITPWCNDMPSAMNALDCLVHPQVGTEAFGGVILEAHACGRPVIATRVDGIPEAFGIGGLGQLIPAESIDALADAMQGIAGATRLTEVQRFALHERVVNASSTNLACEQYERLYRSLPQVRRTADAPRPA